MADERYLNMIRRFWTREQVTQAYQEIAGIDWEQTKRKTIIVAKGNESSSASAQVVVTFETFAKWMEVFETRLQELEAADAGTEGASGGVVSINHAGRYIEP